MSYPLRLPAPGGRSALAQHGTAAGSADAILVGRSLTRPAARGLPGTPRTSVPGASRLTARGTDARLTARPPTDARLAARPPTTSAAGHNDARLRAPSHS